MSLLPITSFHLTPLHILQSWNCFDKLCEIFGCGEGGCCDCCYKDDDEKKLTKSDIHHSFRSNISRLDSTSSGCESVKTFRDRKESDSTASRTDSVSSSSQLSCDLRSTKTPVIDMKPIEFWTANRENVQPRQGRRRQPSETEICVENFQRDLYEVSEASDPCMTDEEKLAAYQLGQIHIGLQYEVTTKVLVVKIIEARDLTPPYCLDENKQDLAHSNPYCKISLLPDQKNSQQTSVQRKTQDPSWNEYFMFEMSFNEAQNRTLEILVKDFDKFSRHFVIGQIYLPLDNINLIKGGHMWKSLSPSTKV